jgi:hypothetical protein
MKEEHEAKLAKKLQWNKTLHETKTTEQVNTNAHEKGSLRRACKKMR